MLSRIAESALAVARARVGAARGGRFNSKAFSTQISKSYAAPASVGPVNAFAQTWYKLFGSSTARYATFLAVGVILAEMGTNSLTDYLWEANNKGNTYKQVDWSKFDPEEEEEEEDDDDDDDDEDDDE
uniref:Cytochrome b-c1 complex subunit 9 n=1 Tax=Pseudo-nitzschia australis TaxID=44445 RepID=A0A7S4EKQ8_9STRA|mmetsp:Transcript_22040/g.47929  ORF Transcript_22040/g.47929 Transcript_22040/m.47929 type:complete len:128 (+) Transcript_22040:201-584(+)|eukprot:CAMPEP_0168186546 /NCGR_PEP_ID=MMETSP0139_2-20121125/14500_1 /TAXON_ID=44445 /ORGANISM="Pseudo-nitzschia australis, Strain 10249 10 AB" /LENGTH=127 /DNA_ID=CAMNT_0008108581 /DNA_START=126 /DNA_END=509 /DNA_ORIENTATION=-